MKEAILQIRDKNKVEGQAEFFEEKRFVIPETFDELKELCKELCNKKSYDICCPYNSSICITKGKLDIDFVKEDFKVYINNCCIAKNRTPQQMWNIIKNLVEE